MTVSSSSTGSSDFQTILDTFGETLDVDALVKMQDNNTLVSYLNELYSNSSITEEEYNNFIDAFEEECTAKHDEAFISFRELEAMLNSGNLSVGEMASIELVMQDLQEIMEACDDGFSSAWGEAVDLEEYQNQEIDAGDTTTIHFDDAVEGSTIHVDASATEGMAGSQSGLSVNPDIDGDGTIDLADVNKDGVIQEHEFWDTDGDGQADYDLNGDNVISEEDNPNFSAAHSTTTVVIDGENVESISLSNYDGTSEPPVATFTVVKEDGTTVFLEITGDAKIIMNPVPTNLESLPTDLAARIYEFTDSTNPYATYTEGYDPYAGGEYYTKIKSSDQNHSVDVTLTSEDFEQNRNIEIELSANQEDDVELNLPDDATVTKIEQGASSKEMILTIETDEGTVTVTIKKFNVTGNDVDSIEIDGGEIATSAYNGLKGWTQGDDIGVNKHITHNGTSIYDEAVDNGYDWTTFVLTPWEGDIDIFTTDLFWDPDRLGDIRRNLGS